MTPFSVIKSADINSSIEDFYSNNQNSVNEFIYSFLSFFVDNDDDNDSKVKKFFI